MLLKITEYPKSFSLVAYIFQHLLYLEITMIFKCMFIKNNPKPIEY